MLQSGYYYGQYTKLKNAFLTQKKIDLDTIRSACKIQNRAFRKIAKSVARYISETEAVYLRWNSYSKRFVRQVAAGTSIGKTDARRTARSILSLPRFPLSFPALRRLISLTAEEMKSRPGRDSRDVCPVIRSALLRASSRECSAAVEYVFRVWKRWYFLSPPRASPADTSYANRVRASCNQRKSNASKYDAVIYEISGSHASLSGLSIAHKVNFDKPTSWFLRVKNFDKYN